jgi:adenine deaminase
MSAETPIPSAAAPFDAIAWRKRIAAARGSGPAELVLRGGRVVNVFTGELEEADVAIAGGRIALVGDYGLAHESIDCRGKIIAPSFIDAHIHLEASLVWLPEFVKAVVPHGTGAVVTDPHELANVGGLPALHAFRDAARGMPLNIRFTAPSCVPASQNESPGARFDVDEIVEVLSWPETAGLGEVMNYPGVLSGDEQIARKLRVSAGRRRDGHSPGLRGSLAQTYAGAGITADHESTELEEARDKLRAGLMIMIREGSTEHNLLELLPLVTDNTYPRFCFASDDRDCHTLLVDGHMDQSLRMAVAAGLDPIRAIRLTTWNAADYWRLDGVGAVAPGYEANLVIFEDLQRFEIETTLFQGKVVARSGKMVDELPTRPIPEFLTESINMAPLMLDQLRLDPKLGTYAVEAVPGQIVTELARVTPVVRDGWAVTDPEQDLLKLVCVERHNATGRVGIGYVKGFGLKRGAMASTIAHDAHNIVAVGVDDTDILAAIATVADSQGGLAVVAEGLVLGHLPLPIGGLLSDQPLEHVAELYEQLEGTARGLGSTLPSPFGLLAFMALSVIPKARVTDRGFIRL